MTTETTETAEDAAKIAAAYFETALRDETDEDSRYTRTKDDAPEWVRDLCHDAHGEMFPDDWKYDCIRAAVDAIAEGYEDSAEFADGQVDTYNGERVAWLASSLSRGDYCQQAMDELGMPDTADYGDVYALIGLGQYMEASEVFGSVLQSLETYAEENQTA